MENSTKQPIFNWNRGIALCTGFISSVLGWYAIILITQAEPWPKPTVDQCIGLGFAFLVLVAGWLYQCFTLIPGKIKNAE
tara:strand:+ start:104 stop:343 length:240 start_codon:yes stop_codon:yes gene_type:complete